MVIDCHICALVKYLRICLADAHSYLLILIYKIVLNAIIALVLYLAFAVLAAWDWDQKSLNVIEVFVSNWEWLNGIRSYSEEWGTNPYIKFAFDLPGWSALIPGRSVVTVGAVTIPMSEKKKKKKQI